MEGRLFAPGDAFNTLSVWVDHFSLSVMCMPRNLKLSTFSTAVLSVLPLLFPEVHNQLLCFVYVEWEVFSWHNTPKALTSSM
jgi:hypothetical protein